jgi:Swi5-dependent recombination DNA repair protein 1
MSTPAAKRRRIDAASQTLSKPFRSPFKTPFKSPVKTSESQDSTSAAAQSNVPLGSKSTSSLVSNLSPTPSLPAPSNSFSTPNHLPRAKKTFSSPVQAAALNADPDIAPLLRAQRELEKQLREVKEELDSAEQARKIEAESAKKDPDGEIDGELMELIGKWKAASQQAAEELFGKVRDRVNR